MKPSTIWQGGVPACFAAYKPPRKPPRNAWTAKEDAIIVQRYPTEGASGLAGVLDRSQASIMMRARALGVKMIPAEKARLCATYLKRHAIYSADDDAYIMRHYAKQGAEGIAFALGRTAASVRDRASRIGAVQRPAWTASEDARITSAWREGATIHQCAEIVQRGRRDTWNRLRQLGLTARGKNDTDSR